MRIAVIVITLLTSLSFAATLDVPRLPEPAFADREVSAAHALPAGRLDGLRVFRLELAFDATPSNNVQVCLGSSARDRARRGHPAGKHQGRVRPGRRAHKRQMTGSARQ